MVRAAKAVVFCAGLVAALAVADFVMKPSLGTVNGWAAAETTRGEVDVLALGSSRTYCTVQPMEMWRHAGVTALDLTGAIQIMPVTLQYLKQALATEKPKVVFVELYMVGKRSTFDTTVAHKNLDYMPLGLPKVEGVLSSVTPGGWFELLFPLQTYHSRWTELKNTDFSLNKHTSYAYGRGAYYLHEASVVPTQPMLDSIGEEAYQRDLVVVKEMARSCDQKGVRLVLYTSPSPYRLAVGNTLLLDRLQADLGADYPGVSFLDLNPVAKQLKIDPSTDYKDELHVNHRGAVVLSRWLADYLLREHGVQDRRRSAFASRWNDELATYDSVFKAEW